MLIKVQSKKSSIYFIHTLRRNVWMVAEGRRCGVGVLIAYIFISPVYNLMRAIVEEIAYLYCSLGIKQPFQDGDGDRNRDPFHYALDAE